MFPYISEFSAPLQSSPGAPQTIKRSLDTCHSPYGSDHRFSPKKDAMEKRFHTADA